MSLPLPHTALPPCSREPASPLPGYPGSRPHAAQASLSEPAVAPRRPGGEPPGVGARPETGPQAAARPARPLRGFWRQAGGSAAAAAPGTARRCRPARGLAGYETYWPASPLPRGWGILAGRRCGPGPRPEGGRASRGRGAARSLLPGCSSPAGRRAALCPRGARSAGASPSPQPPPSSSPVPTSATGGSERAERREVKAGGVWREAAGPGRSLTLPLLPIGRGVRAVRRGLRHLGGGKQLAPRGGCRQLSPAGGRVGVFLAASPHRSGPSALRGPSSGVTGEELPEGGRGGSGAGAARWARPPAGGSAMGHGPPLAGPLRGEGAGGALSIAAGGPFRRRAAAAARACRPQGPSCGPRGWRCHWVAAPRRCGERYGRSSA